MERNPSHTFERYRTRVWTPVWPLMRESVHIVARSAVWHNMDNMRLRETWDIILVELKEQAETRDADF